jgi:hypothetical protein
VKPCRSSSIGLLVVALGGMDAFRRSNGEKQCAASITEPLDVK